MTEQDLLDRGIELIAISFVDNAGLTRAKSITAAKAEAAATRGVGSPHAFSIFQGDDGMSTATGFEAVGDTRLVPDLDRLAGGLDAMRLAVVPVESLYWVTSGQVVIMTLLGGAGTFFGPFVGAGTYLVLGDRLAVFTERWPLVIGLIFMAFVLFLPKGIWGTLVAKLPGATTAGVKP